MASRTIACASGPNGRRCCGFTVRVLRSVSWSVHSWRLTIAFAGNSTIHSPSSIALARTTSPSAVRRATLPISRRYIRTGSSMPSTSAASSSAAGSVVPSHGARLPSRRCLELLSRRLLELLIVERGVSIGGECARLAPILVDHLETDDDRVSGRLGRVEIGVGGLLGHRDRDGARTRGTTAGWPGAGDLDTGSDPDSQAQQWSCDPVPPRQLQADRRPHSTPTPAPRRGSVVTARPPAAGVTAEPTCAAIPGAAPGNRTNDRKAAGHGPDGPSWPARAGIVVRPRSGAALTLPPATSLTLK